MITDERIVNLSKGKEENREMKIVKWMLIVVAIGAMGAAPLFAQCGSSKPILHPSTDSTIGHIDLTGHPNVGGGAKFCPFVGGTPANGPPLRAWQMDNAGSFKDQLAGYIGCGGTVISFSLPREKP